MTGDEISQLEQQRFIRRLVAIDPKVHPQSQASTHTTSFSKASTRKIQWRDMSGMLTGLKRMAARSNS